MSKKGEDCIFKFHMIKKSNIQTEKWIPEEDAILIDIMK